MAATQTVRPEMLAEELNISGKQIRQYLRKEFPRTKDQRNTAWELTSKQADNVRSHFAPADEA
jgi:hypothetical protein